MIFLYPWQSQHNYKKTPALKAKADDQETQCVTHTFGVDGNFSILKWKQDEITNFQFLNAVEVPV